MLFARPRIQPSWVAVRSPRTWLAAMTVVGGTGVPLAAARASLSNPPGLNTVSRLGLDARAGVVLNGTLIGLGLSLLALAVALRQQLARLRREGRLSRGGELLAVAGLVVAAVGISLTGIFTIQTRESTIVHNVAGFATPIVLTATLLGTRVTLKGLGSAFDVASGSILLCAALLYLSSATARVVPYAFMEIACFGLLGLWLWLFEAHLRALIEAPD